jgi:hypothetical protein
MSWEKMSKWNTDCMLAVLHATQCYLLSHLMLINKVRVMLFTYLQTEGEKGKNLPRSI